MWGEHRNTAVAAEQVVESMITGCFFLLCLPSECEEVVSLVRHNFAISHAHQAMYIDWEVYSAFVDGTCESGI